MKGSNSRALFWLRMGIGFYVVLGRTKKLLPSCSSRRCMQLSLSIRSGVGTCSVLRLDKQHIPKSPDRIQETRLGDGPKVYVNTAIQE